MIKIDTPRLILTPPEPADATTLFTYRTHPAVQKYQDWEPSGVQDALDLIAANHETKFDTPDSWFQLGIRLRESNELIGDLGVHFLSAESEPVEIGYTLAPDHWGNGYATEAVRALLDYLFCQLKKHRVIASVDPDNLASIALLNRIGMRQEAHFRQSLRYKEKWVDDVIFAMLRSEWVC